MHKVRYRGTPIFGDDGEEYVEYEPGEKKYVGEPSDEIDDAWNELTTSKSHILEQENKGIRDGLWISYVYARLTFEWIPGRFFLLSEEEAKAQFGPEYTRYWNKGWGGYAARLESPLLFASC